MGTGIPVPATIPEGSKAFILCVPDDPFFYGVVMGALKTTTFRYYWQGSTEQIDAVTERMQTMYYDYQDQVGCMICDMIAQCFEDQDPGLMAAVAEAFRNNPTLRAAISEALTEEGGATPGRPVSDQQAAQDTLPENVRNEEGDCIPDNLWGACLYLVQSGNRAITDFFDILEAASNALEASAIIAQNIPAVGQYAASAAQFADQMRETIAEGYAAAYTEDYEQSLACDLFCLAKADCELSLDQMIATMNARLTSPIDIGDMGEIMAGIASGTWIGDEIADIAFMVYFSAVRFGQQFADKIGVRPLSDLMSLGADQLASDNWQILCDCGEAWILELDFTGSDMPENWTLISGTHVPGSGVLPVISSGGFSQARIQYDPVDSEQILEFTIQTDGYPAGSFGQVFSPYPSGTSFTYNFEEGVSGEDIEVSGLPAMFSDQAFAFGMEMNTTTPVNHITGVRIVGVGANPYTA